MGQGVEEVEARLVSFLSMPIFLTLCSIAKLRLFVMVGQISQVGSLKASMITRILNISCEVSSDDEGYQVESETSLERMRIVWKLMTNSRDFDMLSANYLCRLTFQDSAFAL